jgi:hypothetical protein
MSERDNVVPFPFGMPINSGKPWSDMDDNDLLHFGELGEPIEITAEFLCRTVAECEARLEELMPKAGALGGLPSAIGRGA